MATNVYWVGLTEARKFVEQLPLQYQDRILKAAFRAASKPVREEASRLAPLGDASKRRSKKGNTARTVPLKESIKTVSGGSIRRTGAVGITRTGALRRSPYKAYHAHLVEFGTPGRTPGGWYAKLIRRSGLFKSWKKPAMPAQPFMRPAIDSKSDEVKRSVFEFVIQKKNALAKRLLKKGITL